MVRPSVTAAARSANTSRTQATAADSTADAMMASFPSVAASRAASAQKAARGHQCPHFEFFD